MKDSSHLPLYGAGPLYVITISVCTVTALFLHYYQVLEPVPVSRLLLIVCRVLAVLLILLGPVIWVNAAIVCRLQKNILEKHLITSGAYAYVRHPVYSAFTLFEWGLILWTANLYLLVLIPLYWIFFTVLIRNTEEKWLQEVFGEEYQRYSRRVNRCIPWFPRRNK